MDKHTPAPYLDTPSAIRQVDKSDIARILSDFPEQIEKAGAEFSKVALPPGLSELEKIVFCGMGGSAIGAELACDLPAGLKKKVVVTVKDYDLPAWVDKNTGVVVISYSGETAEALSCYSQAQKEAGVVIAITSGGQLSRRATEKNLPLYKFDYKAPPRDSLGYLFVPAVIILKKAGVLSEKDANLNSAIELIKQLNSIYEISVPTPQNRAKQLAYSLFDRVPIIVGSSITKSVARRWKNQINEHAKTASWFDELPEANHNTVEGFNFPTRFKDDVIVLFLESHFDHPEIVKRQSLWREQLLHQGLQAESIDGQGVDIWSNKLSLVYLGDWVSYYLALLHRTDPAAIPVISELKKKLGAS